MADQKRKINESKLREEIIRVCSDLYQRKMVSSSGGNVSARLGDFILITPTGKSLGNLAAEELVKVDLSGKVLTKGKPSKEIYLHLGVYNHRSDAGAVIHAHSPYAVALSCITTSGTEEAIPPLTPGYVMRIGKLPLIPYLRPGSNELSKAIEEKIKDHNAILLQNHGTITVGKDLEQAINLTEEIEENAKIYLLTNMKARRLTPEEISNLISIYQRKGESSI